MCVDGKVTVQCIQYKLYAGLCPKASVQNAIPRCRAVDTMFASRYLEKCEVPITNHENVLPISTASPERGTSLGAQKTSQILRVADI